MPKNKDIEQQDEAPRDPAQPELRQVRPFREPPPEEQNEHWAHGETIQEGWQ
jgi:hypothetical protein